jgi:hypothetical protein
MFVIEPSDTSNAGMAVQIDGCGVALLLKSLPSVRSWVGLAEFALNLPFTVSRRCTLDYVITWIREWGSILNIDGGKKCCVERGFHYMWGVFTVHYRIHQCHSDGKQV